MLPAHNLCQVSESSWFSQESPDPIWLEDTLPYRQQETSLLVNDFCLEALKWLGSNLTGSGCINSCFQKRDWLIPSASPYYKHSIYTEQVGCVLALPHLSRKCLPQVVDTYPSFMHSCIAKEGQELQVSFISAIIHCQLTQNSPEHKFENHSLNFSKISLKNNFIDF